MELRTIITFVRIAELGNFTKAASELGYAQSTVSMQIQSLENELGFPLFNRIGKYISLTQKGEDFLPYANQILVMLSKIDTLKTEEQQHGKLVIGILESLLYWVFSPLLPEFHQQLPFISIETTTASGTNLFNMLKKGELDVIFMLDKKIFEPDCVMAFSYPVKLIFVASVNHPLATQPTINLETIIKYPLLLTERSSIYRHELELATAERNLELHPLVEVNNTLTLVNLTKAGMGISFLPEYTVKDKIEKGELCQLNVSEYQAQCWAQIFTHKNKWITPQIVKFIEIIRNYYEV